MSTYEKIRKLCQEHGFAISNIPEKIPGVKLTSASISGWKNGAKARASTVKPIADYFGVSVSYLLEDDEPKKEEEDDLSEYLEQLRSRPEMRMLFSVSKNATKEDVERAVRIIEALKGNNDT